DEQTRLIAASHKLSEFPSVRAIDADAGSFAGQRRPERRPQSAVSNRRPAIGPTGPETGVLNGRTCFSLVCSAAALAVLPPARSKPGSTIHKYLLMKPKHLPQ